MHQIDLRVWGKMSQAATWGVLRLNGSIDCRVPTSWHPLCEGRVLGSGLFKNNFKVKEAPVRSPLWHHPK